VIPTASPTSSARRVQRTVLDALLLRLVAADDPLVVLIGENVARRAQGGGDGEEQREGDFEGGGVAFVVFGAELKDGGECCR
jgi:hypothetical protein